ncbi:MAG: hypothetical protein L6V87_07660 [Ruminococcus sp.]|nr:MAG: hypothetical protein L6V87_07660 [Ruminococcus sp.]
MNNDFYSEQLVAKKSGGSETAKKILIGVLTALVAAFLFLIIIFPAEPAAGGSGVLRRILSYDRHRHRV